MSIKYKSSCSIFLGLFFLTINLCFADQAADDIVRKADDIMDMGGYTADLVLTVRRSKEKDRLYKMEIYGSGKDRVLVLLNYPPREKGQAFLRVEDNMWFYLPSINKTLRVPKKSNFVGGDFSNNDVLSVRLQKDYFSELLEDEDVEGIQCYCLKLTARNSDAPYASIKYWINKENYWPVKRVFFTVNGQAFKTMVFNNSVSQIRPDTMTMSNIMEKDKTSEMFMSNIKIRENKPEIFTESYLVRRR